MTYKCSVALTRRNKGKGVVDDTNGGLSFHSKLPKWEVNVFLVLLLRPELPLVLYKRKDKV
jgi:hypothetical protein